MGQQTLAFFKLLKVKGFSNITTVTHISYRICSLQVVSFNPHKAEVCLNRECKHIDIEFEEAFLAHFR